MFSFNSNAKAIFDAMSKSQAIIEFDLSGNILSANENFCSAVGYQLSQIQGKHHSMFVEPAYAASAEYKAFWEKLGRGEFESGQFRRIGNGGREIWIEASYNPVFKGGKPSRVIKFATDITAARIKSMEDAGKLDALSRAQAVIEFLPHGEIVTANENFCAAVGYQLSEIEGKHHSMFCDPAYTASDAYKQFWTELAQGTFKSDEFKRFGKGGNEIWIQATYNPILDDQGNVFRVVKFATDITARVHAVETLAGSLQQLADGNLDQSINEQFPDNLEGLRSDFNGSVRKLEGAMRNVGANANEIAASSAEIRSAADDLSKRTEQQAASVEETAAALEEITTTVADSTQRAEEAGDLVSQTRENAEHSGKVVKEAIDAMGEIEGSSNEINSIIDVIDDIAFQTNLLALNAGVEAARAGDAGKGFAVVAQEVRELAHRSANAAKEIKELITKSGEQVKRGVSLVGRTGEALDKIVTQVVDINTNVAAIVEAAREQSTGLKEINTAVNTMDQGTQQNAAMVEESTAASHSLASQADALSTLLSQFKMGSGTANVQPDQKRPAPVPANADAAPVVSPARAMTAKVAQAMGANAASTQEWEDF
ncbi:MAG: PAS domain-containing methyl-accepting chemotaxis protein [Alphaproteobacteria bacterium]|nr:PAS domain-containing methyl-accepting chemotaxis protein [Alphaproteobacteria bacterium]